MANLQIKGIEGSVYKEIKDMAAAEHRSVSQQILFLVKNYLARKKHANELKSPAQVLLELSGSWDDRRSADKILSDIKSSRKNSKKLSKGF